MPRRQLISTDLRTAPVQNTRGVTSILNIPPRFVLLPGVCSTMKVRRYMRDSGRILAFVFVASVVWLLFDMAALRLSFNDPSSLLLKERMVKERELSRLLARTTQPVNRRFRHPVQKVDPALKLPVKDALGPAIDLAQVYRRGRGGRQEQLMKGNSVDDHPKGGSKHEEGAKHGATVEKKAVNLDLNEAKLEKSSVVDVPKEVAPPAEGSDEIQVPNSKKEAAAIVEKPDSKQVRDKVGQPEEAHPDEPTPKPVQPEDVKVEQRQETGKKDVGPPKQPHKPVKLEAGEGSKVKATTKPGGVHKVRSLDVTQSPRDDKALGQFGHAALVGSEEDGEVRRRWDEGHFNVYLSDQIPLDRAIPDTRPEMCARNLVHDDLPTTSVIFCFVDEVWSTLLRSVHSVINRSPEHLLKEIILVDDFSTRDYLKEPLDKYMSQFPKVRIVRLKEREGLIRARLAGAAVAKGDVLTFLDSHVECNVGWLEPLLERVYQDRRKVPCPVIEVISDKDMSYNLVDNFQRGIFKWPLVFGWSPVPDSYIKETNMTIADPIRCPVMAGGLFSIDKKFFYELGAYDPGLDVWGGENMEISFKIWMCGGEIEIIPCSRVGHIFRGQNPYKFPKDRQKTVERNLARVVEVWLDGYKDLFYGHGYHHLLDKEAIHIGNLTDQIELRKKLECKSFKWYLDNVYPDMVAPLVKAEGMVFNLGLRKCLSLQKGSLSFETCDLSRQSQLFNHTWMRHIRQQDLCIAPQAKGNGVALKSCDNADLDIRWFHQSTNSALAEHLISESVSHHMCLEAGPQGDSVCLKPCVPTNALQKWQFTHYHHIQ
ncbi:polypeptide N-acetylgalactosaminyltransferase 5 [Platichthys flesus]|uniref:polypeptide N-acetylgalactosaminyltransferase 5 n=1 Tax=Platichthys flesus TaxID=8260 RepID=UPI002DBB9DEC|nr:polypeptide N-acetylgalactosaminyltransferase 5 [Platichthys flesus]